MTKNLFKMYIQLVMENCIKFSVPVDNFNKPYYNDVTITKEGIGMAYTVSKETAIGELLRMAPEAAPILMQIGMHCLG